MSWGPGRTNITNMVKIGNKSNKISPCLTSLDTEICNHNTDKTLVLNGQGLKSAKNETFFAPEPKMF